MVPRMAATKVKFGWPKTLIVSSTRTCQLRIHAAPACLQVRSRFYARRSAQPDVALASFFAYSQSMDLLTSDEIVRLSPSERLTLIAQLWESLEQDQVPLRQAQQAELERRLASLDQDRRQGVTWAALKAELEQRCP